MKTFRNVVLSPVLFLLLVNSLQGQQNAELAIRKYQEDQSVVFKECEGDDLKLCFFSPEGDQETKTRPAIVFFFGGGWVGGTPSQFRPHAEYLRSRGMIAVLADYRTRKSHGTTPRECVADALSAVRYLRIHADKFGIDAERIVAAGGSAGGHLAAATSTVVGFDEQAEDSSVSARPNALVLFNPVCNNGPDQWGHKTVKEYWRKISPAHNIREGIPPAIVFLGRNDKLISVETARDFQKSMKAVGARSDLHLYDGKGHGFFNYGRDKNAAFIDTVEKMDRFLVELGYLKGSSTVGDFVKQR